MIAVIGLVIVFAGPGVASAIRNQFNTVTNTVDGGTSGDAFLTAEEKAYREAMKTVTEKDAKDWTLAEQKAAATDISKNGTSSVVYAKAKAAMDAGTTWSVKLTDGKTMTYRIIGINHDDLADGSGKAGLTFWTTYKGIGNYKFNSTDTNVGGWEKSELRQKMNSGEIWNLLPIDSQSKIQPVTKLTNNVGGGDANKNAPVTATTDRLFLLSSKEMYSKVQGADDYPFLVKEGFRYEAFSGDLWNQQLGAEAWSRSIWPYNGMWESEINRMMCTHPNFGLGSNSGVLLNKVTKNEKVLPAFCF